MQAQERVRDVSDATKPQQKERKGHPAWQGRTQLAVWVRPEIRTTIRTCAHEAGVTMSEWTERAVQALADEQQMPLFARRQRRKRNG
jgi:hypothetical protein